MLYRLPLPHDAHASRSKPVVANASLAVSAVSVAVYFWGYTIEAKAPMVHPGITYFFAGWVGFLISLVLSKAAIEATREGARARVAFYVGVWGATLPLQQVVVGDIIFRAMNH
jgi:hypothetical protein